VIAAATLATVYAAGVRVSLSGDHLVLEADMPPSPDLIHALAGHKAAIAALLRQETAKTDAWVRDVSACIEARRPYWEALLSDPDFLAEYARCQGKAGR